MFEFLRNEIVLISCIPLSVAILSYYIIQIASEHKALKSISDSNYWLKKPWRLTFEAVMCVVGLSLVYTGYFLKESEIWLLMSSGAGVCGVAAFSRFKKNRVVKFMHYLCAYVGFGSLALSILFSFSCPGLFAIPVLVAILTLIYSRSKDVFIWNIEVNLIYACFMCVYPLILIEYF